MMLDGILNITTRHWNDDASRGLEKHTLIDDLYKTSIPHPISQYEAGGRSCGHSGSAC